ncbi:MAG: FkbM family methyltransferase [Saprospiraceae bacterium]
MNSLFALIGLNATTLKFLSTPLKKMVLKHGKGIYLEHHWERQFAYRDRFVFSVDDDLKIVGHRDSYISMRLFEGNFERQEISFIKRYLRPDESFMDIGANIGYHTLIAANQLKEGKGKVYAFEPTPLTFDWLVENIAINGFEHVVAQAKAMSNERGRFLFNQYHGGKDAYNSFGDVMRSAPQTAVEVETTTIDQFMGSIGTASRNISLIKIDVEGWEYPVFKGGIEFLSRPDAPVLMVEFTDQNARKAGFSCQKVYDIGRELGYTWLEMVGDELKLSPKKSFYEYSNLYATKDVELLKRRLMFA